MKGEQIKKLRERLGWSQQRLADYLGWSEKGGRGTISNAESDTYGVGGSTLRLLQLLRLYGRHAGRLWDRRYRKQIKEAIKGEPDENND